MSRKRFSAEQIINHLREAEVLLAQCKAVGKICRRTGVSEHSSQDSQAELPHSGGRLLRAKSLIWSNDKGGLLARLG